MGKREAPVESYLKREVKKLGGETRKYKSQPGVADQLCFLPGGHLWLVEVKSDTGRESPMQQRERELMTNLGFRSRVAYGMQAVTDIINEMREVINAGSTTKTLNFLSTP